MNSHLRCYLWIAWVVVCLASFGGCVMGAVIARLPVALSLKVIMLTGAVAFSADMLNAARTPPWRIKL